MTMLTRYKQKKDTKPLHATLGQMVGLGEAVVSNQKPLSPLSIACGHIVHPETGRGGRAPLLLEI